jgi:hypothetical protein
MCHFVSRLLLATIVLVFVPTAGALACSYIAPEPSLMGMPNDGAFDVPTDVVPYFARPVAFELFDAHGNTSSQFTLVSAAGAAIPLQTKPFGSEPFWNGFELVPESPLAPNTNYVLTARWIKAGTERTSELRFTTGAGPLVGVPQPPSVSLRHYHRNGPLSSCEGSAYGTCVTVQPDVFVETVHIDEHGQSNFKTMYQGSFETNLSRREQHTDFRCVRLRTRAINGTYSEPVEACGADYGTLVELPRHAIACGPGAITETPVDAGRPSSLTKRDAAVSKADAAALNQTTSEQDESSAGASADASESIDDEGCSVTRSSQSAALSMLIALATLLLSSRRRRDTPRA